MSDPALHRLPIQHEFRISPRGAIFSRQQLTVPPPWLPPDRPVTTAQVSALGPLYFQRLPTLTRGLIAVTPGMAVTFRLRPFGLTLLRFGAPVIEAGPEGGQSGYPIVGGWALARGGATEPGALCLGLWRDDAGLHASMTIQGYYARLMGRERIHPLRRLLYERSQAALHHLIARDFVRQVARAFLDGTLA